jgi:hypothetical protein
MKVSSPWSGGALVENNDSTASRKRRGGKLCHLLYILACSFFCTKASIQLLISVSWCIAKISTLSDDLLLLLCYFLIKHEVAVLMCSGKFSIL